MEFHVTLIQCTAQLSWSVLLLGVSNIFWTPTAICIGKRPVILISMTILLGERPESWLLQLGADEFSWVHLECKSNIIQQPARVQNICQLW